MPRSTRYHSGPSPLLRGWPLAVLLLGTVAILASSGVLLWHLAFRTAARSASSTPSPVPLPSSIPGPVLSQAITKENALPGTTDWMLPDPGYSLAIQAYASALSISPGVPLTFYVSTQQARMPYTVQFYRLGWYGGAGGRLLLTRHEIGQAQGIYDPSTQKLIGCSSCFLDPSTHLLEANWQPSFHLTIPDTWVTGLYEAKFIDAAGHQAAVPFTVRGSPKATYLVVLADNTTEAYNAWGGYSLYHGLDGTAKTRALKVSFDRPLINWLYAIGNSLSYEIDTIRWLERQGYDVAYCSSVDIHENPGQLLSHRAMLSLGHDEYWSKAMRDGMEQARNHGVGLAFLGANDGYWQIRYEPDHQGVLDRTIVCYKSAKLDPLHGTDNALVTALWRNPPLDRPENALIGIEYVDQPYQRTDPPKAAPWRISPKASSPLLEGTGLEAGQSYGCNLVGYEWDEVIHNGATPAGLTVLGASPVTALNGQARIGATTYYIAPSGAFVFASGSIYWSYALDDLRLWDFQQAAQVIQSDPCLEQSRAVPGIQKLMEHVMGELITDHKAWYI